MLDLQRLAGNGAVTSFLGGSSLSVQRRIVYTPEMLKASGGRSGLFRSSAYNAVHKALRSYHAAPEGPKAASLLGPLIVACERWLASKDRSAAKEKDLAIVAILHQAKNELQRLTAPATAAAPPAATPARPAAPAAAGYNVPIGLGGGVAPAAGYNVPIGLGGGVAPAAGSIVPGGLDGPAAAPTPAPRVAPSDDGTVAPAAAPAPASSDYANNPSVAAPGTRTAPIPQQWAPRVTPAPTAQDFDLTGWQPPAPWSNEPNHRNPFLQHRPHDPESMEPEAIMHDFKGAFLDFDTTAVGAHYAEHERWDLFQQAADPTAGTPKITPQTWNKVPQRNIRGLTPADRPDYELHPQRQDDGSRIFYWGKTKKAYTTSEMKTLTAGGTAGRAIFVMTADGRIFTADMTAEYTAGRAAADADQQWIFHHSSFLAGQPVASAGELAFDDQGRLTDVADASGHYRPTSKFTVQLLQRLRTMGVDISGVGVRIHEAQRESGLQLQLPTIPATVLCDFDGDTVAISKFIQQQGAAGLTAEAAKAQARGGVAGRFEAGFWTESKQAMRYSTSVEEALQTARMYHDAGTRESASRLVLKALSRARSADQIRDILQLTFGPGQASLGQYYGRELAAFAKDHENYDVAAASVRDLRQILQQLGP